MQGHTGAQTASSATALLIRGLWGIPVIAVTYAAACWAELSLGWLLLWLLAAFVIGALVGYVAWHWHSTLQEAFLYCLAALAGLAGLWLARAWFSTDWKALLTTATACVLLSLCSRVARHIPSGKDDASGLERTVLRSIGKSVLGDTDGCSAVACSTALSPRDDAGRLVDQWKTVINVQMHFNEMLQRIRLLGLPAALTVMAGAALAAKESVAFRVGAHQLSLACPVQLCAVLLILGLMFFEAYFYALLLGAVEVGERIESTSGFVPLTTAISRKVPRDWARRRLSCFWYTAFWPALLFWFLVTVQPPSTVTGQGEPSLASGPAKPWEPASPATHAASPGLAPGPLVSPKGGGVDARRP